MLIISIYLSFVFFIFSVYFFLYSPRKKFQKLCFCLLVLVFLNLYYFYYTVYYLIGGRFNSAVIYHLKFGLAGADFPEFTGLIIALSVLIVGSIVLSIWLFLKKTKKILYKVWGYYFSLFLITVAILLNPIVYDLYNIYKYELNIGSVNGDDFYKYYREPKIEQVGKKKNLIYIYAEGLERTYWNEEIFPGLIRELRPLEDKGVSFSNLNGVAGARATISGIVASQCGLPLFSPNGNTNNAFNFDGYLAGAVCLSDLLNQADYYQVYFGGVDTAFAGKDKFFSSHHYDEYYGKAELSRGEEGENDGYEWRWGLYDEALFGLAYEKAEELSLEESPFGMYIMTLDTHHPNGHPSPFCKDIVYDDGSNAILNAVACSDFLISRFINRIASSSFASDTVVVLSSDHLAHRNTAYSLLKKENRRNMFLVLDLSDDTREAVQIDKVGSALDISPTILPFIGFESELGLGRNLLNNKESSKEIEKIQGNLLAWQQSIASFWKFSKEFTFDVRRVAHAGGGIDGELHKNTLEALDYNLEKGATYFEIDFNYTSDNKLVCIHDWQESFKKSFGVENSVPVSYQEFIAMVDKNYLYKNCTLKSLSKWLEKNPGAYVVTDVKDDNLKALKDIAMSVKDFSKRIIPQVYDPDNFAIIKDMGFEQMIWTLYRYKEKDDLGAVLAWANKFDGPFAVTMPESLAMTALPGELRKIGVPTYVHTVNSETEMLRYFNNDVTEIYTDFLIN
jgi:phosphoglycerol transferase